MSFGANQGTIRYALMVDDAQATQAITRFKTNVTSLGTPTANLSKNMGVLQNNFKGVSGGLTSTNTLFGQTSIQTVSLGTKIKDTASKFAGFATGLAVTSAGILQLAAGFRDYNDAQIAVERVTRKLSLANEAVDKTTRKVVALQKQGKTNTKEYADAVRDQTQAQQMQEIQTQLLGEAQERLFDSQSQFVTSLIPTSLGAIGTLGSAFRDLGGGKGLGGLTAKFKGFGGTFANMVTGLTGIGGASTVAGTGLKGLGLSAVTAAGGLSGMVALAGPIAGLIKTLMVAGELLPKTGELFTGNIEDRIKTAKTWLDKLKELPIFGGTADILDKLTGMSKGIDKVGNSAEAATKPVENFSNGFKTLPSSVNAAANSSSALVNSIIVLRTQAEKGQITWNQYFDALAKLKIPGKDFTAIMDEVNVRMKTNATVVSTASKTTQVFSKDTLVLTSDIIDFEKAIAQSEVTVAKNDSTIAAFGDTIDNLAKKFGALKKAAAIKFPTPDQVLSSTLPGPFGGNPSARTQTIQDFKDLNNLANQTNTTAKALNKTWEVDAGKIAAENTAKALEKARQMAEKFKQSLAAAQTDIKGVFKIDSNADKILKNLIKKLPSKAEKEIKLQLKFAQSVEDNKKAFNDLLFEATQVSDKTADSAAKEIIKTIDDKFKGAKGAFAGLRTALQTAIADPNTPEALKTLLMNFNWDTVGTTTGKKIGTAINQGIVAAANAGGGLANLWETGGKGGKGAITIPAPVIPAPVTTAFDAGVKTATTSVANIAKTVPVISVNNKSALKDIDIIAKRIDSLTKINPQIPVNNKPAIKAVDAVAKRIDSLSKINPPINVNNKPALKAIDVIAKRITSLPTGNVTVKVNYDTSGKPAGVKAQHGFHGTLIEDTTILAHKGERVDIGRANSSGETRPSSSGGGGGTGFGGGNLTINNVIDIGTERIVRTVKRKLGQGFYAFGA